MFRHFKSTRFATVGLMLGCLFVAIVGAVVVDYFIRLQQTERRNAQRLQQIERRNALMGRHLAREEVRPRSFSGFDTKTFAVGSPAPEFALPDAIDGHEVRLADFRGKKPVVLIFGSFGCEIFCGQLARLNKLHQTYKDRAEFLLVYIYQGPHAGLVPLPTEEDRDLGYIPRGLRHFRIAFTCLLENKDTEKAYRPFPARLVLVDRPGRIALDAGLVLPKGWDLNSVEACLKRMCSPAEARRSVK